MAKLTRDNVPFTQIVNELLNDKSISFQAKGIYAYLFSKPDDWDFSAERIAEESSDGRKAVLSSLRELESVGWISRKKLSTGRVEYRLHCSKEPESPNGTLGLFPETKVPKRHRAQTALISNKDIYIKIPEWVNPAAWAAWVQHRKELGKKMTPTSVKRQIRFLEQYKPYHVEIIDTSIRQGWTGFFAPKGKENLKEATTSETPKEVKGYLDTLSRKFVVTN